jgi:hypothetical protein
MIHLACFLLLPLWVHQLDARKDEVWNGSWPCQNGLGVVGPDSKDPGISQATIAAISGPTPTMFMTRVRL